MNYYQIHKNKKPKKLPKRRLNPKRAYTSMLMAMNACEIAVIQSNVFKDKALKCLQIAEVVISTADKIRNLYSAKQKYLDRIKKQR